jgi:site-specific recombinase XerD
MDELARHMDAYCAGGEREQFLFLTRNATHPLRANFTRDAIGPALSRSAIGKHVTWLTLRHTAASLMFDAGLTIFEVQQRLGNKSPAMTAEVYTHLMRERFEEGRQRMEDYVTRTRARGVHGDTARDATR